MSIVLIVTAALLLAVLNRRLSRRENPRMPVAVTYLVLIVVLALLSATIYFFVVK
jgi:drug/metabolite transporter (DMT)-like permease